MPNIHPDAELLALGRQWAAAYAEADLHYRQVMEPAEQRCSAIEQALGEAAAKEASGLAAASRTESELIDRKLEIERKIAGITAHTLAGLAETGVGKRGSRADPRLP